MKIESMEIKKFRSIKYGNFRFSNIVALVGENNSGKSSILRAINVFFNFEEECNYFINRNHVFSSNSQSSIEIIFSNIEYKELENFTYDEKLVIKFIYKYKFDKETYQYKMRDGYHQLPPEILDFIKNKVRFILIPNSRDCNDIAVNEDSILLKVILEYISIQTSKRDNLSPKVKQAMKYIKKYALEKIENELDKSYPLSHNFKFDLHYKSETGYKILLNNIDLSLIESEKKFNIRDCGSGIQSITIISLYSLLADLRDIKYIIGIEEPETNLHPQMQREFISLVKEKGISKNNIQIIFSTHSSVMCDQLNHEEIILIRKEDDSQRGFITKLYQIPNDFWEKHDLECFKYYQFYKYRNSEFFFSKYIIIVESKNDAEIIKKLLEKMKIDINRKGINILDLGGVLNIKYPYYLLKYLKIPFFIIVDKDFFIPYENDKLDDSRYRSGFPKYKLKYKDESFIDELIPNVSDKGKLLSLFNKNHSKAMDILEKYDMISFKYSLEIDLIASNIAREIYFNILDISEQKNQCSRFLLINRKNQIKKIEHMLKVIDRLPHKNLPNSYKRIKRILNRDIKKL